MAFDLRSTTTQAEDLKAQWLCGVPIENLHYMCGEDGYDDPHFFYDELDERDAAAAEAAFFDEMFVQDVEIGGLSPALAAHAADYEKRRRRRHTLETRVNLDENHPDACYNNELCRDMWKLHKRATRRHLNATLLKEGLVKCYEDFSYHFEEDAEDENDYFYCDDSYFDYDDFF